MFANHMYDKALVSKLCKELSKLNNKKTIEVKKMGKRVEQTLHQRSFTDGT